MSMEGVFVEVSGSWFHLASVQAVTEEPWESGKRQRSRVHLASGASVVLVGSPAEIMQELFKHYLDPQEGSGES